LKKVKIPAGAKPVSAMLRSMFNADKNYVVLVRIPVLTKNFPRLIGSRETFSISFSTVFILTVTDPSNYEIEAVHE